ncbi:TolC family protein [Lacunimicrobium album]
MSSALILAIAGCQGGGNRQHVSSSPVQGTQVVPAGVATWHAPESLPAEITKTTFEQPTASDSAPLTLVSGTSSSASETKAVDNPAAPSVAAAPTPQVSEPDAFVVPGIENAVPIDLATALAVTAGESPQIGFAKQRIQESFARLERAEVLWVPSIRAGVNYNRHTGTIQDVAGNVFETTRSSVYSGFGAQAVGASSPAVPGLVMNFHLRDAIFGPRIAEQTVCARRFGAQAVTNDNLLQTSLAYLDLLEAIQIKAVQEETLAHAEQLADITGSFAKTGEGLQADFDRANTELSLRRIEMLRAVEGTQVASVKLAQQLSAQQCQFLMPTEPAMTPIELVDHTCPCGDLITTGLSYRPEFAESRHIVGEAIERYKREKYAPFVPSVLMGFSYGGNGGSIGNDIDNFGGRTDFDAAAYWEVRNLGFGEKAARREAQSGVEMARWQVVRQMDQISAEIAQAHVELRSRRSQVDLAQQAISAARDSYRRNQERIQAGQGLPLETLQSLQALNNAQREYVRVVADYNRSQFTMQRALGWPIQ